MVRFASVQVVITRAALQQIVLRTLEPDSVSRGELLMRRRLIIAALGSLLCMPAAAQRPTPEEQRRTLDSARDVAIHYSRMLPDFICTEQVQRTDRTSPTNIKVDRLTIDLSYFNQKEKQKLVAMNGTKTGTPLESLDGLITGGEFGALLLGVFDPSSSADFQWKESSNIRKRRTAVYTYRVARANSHYILGSRAAAGNMVEAAAGYRGEVVLESETARVLRLTASADDIPKGSAILQSSVEVDYDFVEVAGRTYLLPSRSEAHMERSYRQITNVVTFADYRKFEVASSIDFGPPKR
jgi:hypothetical protein